MRPQGYKVREATTIGDPSQVSQQDQGHEGRKEVALYWHLLKFSRHSLLSSLPWQASPPAGDCSCPAQETLGTLERLLRSEVLRTLVLKEWNTSERPSQEGFGHLSWRAQGPWARSRGAGRVSYPQGKSRRERPSLPWELTQTPILFTWMEGHVDL